MGAPNPARGTAKPTVAAHPGLKDLPHTHTSLKHSWLPTGGGAWGGGGYCSPQTVKPALAAFPPQQPFGLAARRLFQETSFQFSSWPRWVLLVPLEGQSRQLAGREHPEHPASRSGMPGPQRHARTGSSKLRCCRRNAPTRHFRGGRSPCRDTGGPPGMLRPSPGGRRRRRRNGAHWWFPPRAWPDGRGFAGSSCAASSSWVQLVPGGSGGSVALRQARVSPI